MSIEEEELPMWKIRMERLRCKEDEDPRLKARRLELMNLNIRIEDAKKELKKQQDALQKLKNNIRERIWQEENKEKYLASARAYSKTPAGRTSQKRRQHKRERNLDWIEINSCFNKSCGHHVTKEYVIYIPEEIHKSVSHNIFSGKNMDEINNYALTYLWFYG